MNENEQEKLVASWISYQKHFRAGSEKEELFWAYEKLDDLCRKNPDLALNVILRILHTDSADYVVENLSAGPLEDLLARFGSEIIDRIETVAQTDPALRELLGGVWQSEIDDNVWERIQALCSRRW